MRVVDAQRLDPHPARRVHHEVEGEDLPRLEAQPLLQPHDEGGAGQVPQALVEEGRVEQGARRVPGRHVQGVDAQPPRRRRGRAEELLVEPVAPAPDRLPDQQGGGQGVRDWPQARARAPRSDPGAHRAEGDRSPDAEAAAPYLPHLPRVPARPEVLLGRGDHMVEAGADDAQGDRPQGQVEEQVGVPAAPPVAARGPRERDDHADRDDDPVGAQRHRAHVPHADRRRGDPGLDERSHRRAPFTPPTSSSASAPSSTSARSKGSENRVRTSADPTMTPSA